MLARATTAAPCRGASTDTNQQRKSRNVDDLAASIDLRSRQLQLHETSSCSMTGRRGIDPDALMSASDLRIRLRFFHCFAEDARHLFTSAARGRTRTVLRSAGNGCIRERYRAFSQSNTEERRVSCHRIDAADMVIARVPRPSRPFTCAAPYRLCCSPCYTSNVTGAEYDAKARRSRHANQGPSTLTNYMCTSLLFSFEVDMYFFPWSLIVLVRQMNALVSRPPSIRSMHDDRCMPIAA